MRQAIGLVIGTICWKGYAGRHRERAFQVYEAAGTNFAVVVCTLVAVKTAVSLGRCSVHCIHIVRWVTEQKNIFSPNIIFRSFSLSFPLFGDGC